MKRRLERLQRIRTRQRALASAAHQSAVHERKRASDRLATLAEETEQAVGGPIRTYELEARAAQVEEAEAELDQATVAVRHQAVALQAASTREEKARRLVDRAHEESARAEAKTEQRALDEFSQRGSR